MTACAPNSPKNETVNGCEIRPETQCSKFALNEADLSDTDLRGADLRGADLSQADLKGARYNKNTRFPEDFDPDNAWMMLVE